MKHDPDMLCLLDDEPGGGRDATCFLLEHNSMLIQRPAPRPAEDTSIKTEPTEVVIEVVGLMTAEMAAPWVLLLG